MSELRCGCEKSTDLDVFCMKCIKGVSPVALFSGIAFFALFVVYLLTCIIYPGYSTSFYVFAILGVLFCVIIISVLKVRPLEMLMFLAAFLSVYAFCIINHSECPSIIIEVRSKIETIGLVAISAPIVLAIIFGFIDASKYQKYGNGSLWIVSWGLFILLLSLISFVSEQIPFLDTNEGTFFDIVPFANWFLIYYKTVYAFLILIAIFYSLIKTFEYNEKFTDKSESNNTSTSNNDRLLNTLLAIFYKAPKTGFEFFGRAISRFFSLTLVALINLLANTAIRTFLLVVRLLKTALVIFLCYVLLYSISEYSSEYIATLWSYNNTGEIFSSRWYYLISIVFIILSFLGIELVLILSSRKYRTGGSNEEPISIDFLKKAFLSSLIKPEVTSISYTTAWYLCGTVIAFWFNWACIFILRLSPADNLPLGGLMFYGTSILIIITLVVCYNIEKKKGNVSGIFEKNKEEGS